MSDHSPLSDAMEQTFPPVSLPSQHLPGKVRVSEWGRMKLPKSSENMLKAFSMGGSWAGRAREAEEEEEEEEEEWKLLSALKAEEVRWLIHRQQGPCLGRGWAGEASGCRPPGKHAGGPDCQRFIRPGRPWAQGQPLVCWLNLGLFMAQRGLEIFLGEMALLTA